MNNKRRKQIQKLNDTISDARALLEELRDEEQEIYDNMPEAFQQGERGSISEAAIEALDEAITHIEEAEASLDTAID